MDYPDPQFANAARPSETALNTLNTAELFALWAIRLWVRAYRNGGVLLPQLREGFVAAGAPHAFLALDEFMTRLLGSVRRPLDLRGPQAPQISVDEQGLLRWLAALQRDEAPPPCANLRAIAEPGAVLAQQLAGAGLLFGNASTETQQGAVH